MLQQGSDNIHHKSIYVNWQLSYLRQVSLNNYYHNVSVNVNEHPEARKTALMQNNLKLGETVAPSSAQGG